MHMWLDAPMESQVCNSEIEDLRIELLIPWTQEGAKHDCCSNPGREIFIAQVLDDRLEALF